MDPINYLLLDLRNGTNHNASYRLCCSQRRCRYLRAIQGHNDQVAQARARNQYDGSIQATLEDPRQTVQRYSTDHATKLGHCDLQMNAADRAASRAYGIEQYKQSQRLKQAAFQGMRLDRALAKSRRAAAAGKSGRSAQRLTLTLRTSLSGIRT